MGRLRAFGDKCLKLQDLKLQRSKITLTEYLIPTSLLPETSVSKERVMKPFGTMLLQEQLLGAPEFPSNDNRAHLRIASVKGRGTVTTSICSQSCPSDGGEDSSTDSTPGGD
jgi:hypothetical protein